VYQGTSASVLVASKSKYVDPCVYTKQGMCRGRPAFVGQFPPSGSDPSVEFPQPSPPHTPHTGYVCAVRGKYGRNQTVRSTDSPPGTQRLGAIRCVPQKVYQCLRVCEVGRLGRRGPDSSHPRPEIRVSD
jgi:hypothetical protein